MKLGSLVLAPVLLLAPLASAQNAESTVALQISSVVASLLTNSSIVSSRPTDSVRSSLSSSVANSIAQFGTTGGSGTSLNYGSAGASSTEPGAGVSSKASSASASSSASTSAKSGADGTVGRQWAAVGLATMLAVGGGAATVFGMM